MSVAQARPGVGMTDAERAAKDEELRARARARDAHARAIQAAHISQPATAIGGAFNCPVRVTSEHDFSL